MAHALQRHHWHPTLNTDGRPHPRENALTTVTVVAAVVAVACAFVPSLHVLGSWAGIVGMLVGGLAQYLSATTAERMVVVPAIIGSALGLAFGLVNGGLF
jgi:hypothetical protein